MRDAILGLIRRERDGEPQDRLLLKNAVQVFIELGFKTTRDHSGGAALQLYKTDLQQLLIEQTREFYAGKAKLWLAQDSCPDYMLKAEVRMRLQIQAHTRTSIAHVCAHKFNRRPQFLPKNHVSPSTCMQVLAIC